MNRYTYRAKSCGDDKWVYGSYIVIPPPPTCFGESLPETHHIAYADPRYVPDWGLPYKMVMTEVDCQTVCQCLDIWDDNDVCIFEKDVIEFCLSEDEIPSERWQSGCVVWSRSHGRWVVSTQTTRYGFVDVVCCRVVGNRFDGGIKDELR